MEFTVDIMRHSAYLVVNLITNVPLIAREKVRHSFICNQCLSLASQVVSQLGIVLSSDFLGIDCNMFCCITGG